MYNNDDVLLSVVIEIFVALVAVDAFPAQEPDDPVQSPVTFPTRAPVNVVAVKVFVLALYFRFGFTRNDAEDVVADDVVNGKYNIVFVVSLVNAILFGT